jgi:hypothetical protein
VIRNEFDHKFMYFIIKFGETFYRKDVNYLKQVYRSSPQLFAGRDITLDIRKMHDFDKVMNCFHVNDSRPD